MQHKNRMYDYIYAFKRLIFTDGQLPSGVIDRQDCGVNFLLHSTA